MAGENGRTSHPLIQNLLEEAPTYSFFQAVRVLQALHPEAPKVGFQGPPRKECLRFTSTLALGFPSSDMSSVTHETPGNGMPTALPEQELDEEGSEAFYDPGEAREAELLEPRYRVATTFLGLYGTDSPLPASYTEEMIEEEDAQILRGFYDIFQHRFLSLFYRVWERYRYAIRFQAEGDDYYSTRLAHLLHLSPKLRPAGHRIPAARMLAFAGPLSQQPRSASSLRGVLAFQFPEVSVQVEDFVGRWLPIPEDQQCRLALSQSTLGVDAHLGRYILDKSCTFRVRVEPRDLPEFLRFLPGGDRVAELRELVDLFTTDFLDYEVEVSLHEDAVPELRLSAESALLGWSTWLGEFPPPEERRIRILFQGALHG